MFEAENCMGKRGCSTHCAKAKGGGVRVQCAVRQSTVFGTCVRVRHVLSKDLLLFLLYHLFSNRLPQTARWVGGGEIDQSSHNRGWQTWYSQSAATTCRTRTAAFGRFDWPICSDLGSRCYKGHKSNPYQRHVHLQITPSNVRAAILKE